MKQKIVTLINLTASNRSYSNAKIDADNPVSSGTFDRNDLMESII